MINILAHELTPAQLDELGLVPTHVKAIDPLLAGQIANCPPDADRLFKMAEALCLAAIAENPVPHVGATILAGSGSPAFTACLGLESSRLNVRLVFAHSERVSEDAIQADGSVRKVSTFRHVKFFTV